MLQKRGQALLMVIIAMAAMVTVVLSVVSRSVTDVSLSTKEEEAVRSFSVAEAGLERSLYNLQPATGNLNNATFTTSVVFSGQGQTTYTYPRELLSGESATFWFVSHDTDYALVCDAGNPCFTGSSMKVCWGYPGTSGNIATTPAIEVTLFFDPDANINITNVGVLRTAIDPNATRLSQNRFSGASGSCTVGAVTYPFSTTVDFSSLGVPGGVLGLPRALLFAKVRVLYNTDQAHPLAIDVTGSGGTLPAQAIKVESQGSAGDSQRKVEAHKLFPEVPTLFDSVVYSPGSITK